MTTRRLFVTGTDTGVGKTHATVWLVRELKAAGYRVGAYKPVCSGALPGLMWEDADRLWEAIGGEFPLERVAPQRFQAPLAPPVAAALEGTTVDEQKLIAGADWWNSRVDVLLVEGAGGWLSPLSDNWTNANLAVRLEADVLLVAANRLGVVNHALLSIDHIRRHRPLAGVFLNQASQPAIDPQVPRDFDHAASNREEIERRSGVALWGLLTYGEHPKLMDGPRPAVIDWKKIL